MPMDEIEIIKQRLIEQVNPTCVYLFGVFVKKKDKQKGSKKVSALSTYK